jgi:hypothetical protein
MYIEKLAS